MADKYTEAELKAMYPNTYKPTLAEQVGLSSDPRRRAAMIAYGNSPSMWPEVIDLDAEAARLEQLYTEAARIYPNSAADMISHAVNSSRDRVMREMIEDQKLIDAAKAELAASQEP